MIFIFLGNFQDKYKNTRHNVGRMFGDFLTNKLSISSKEEKKLATIVNYCSGDFGIFLKCFMNESGQCLKKIIANLYPDWKDRQDFQDLYLVHDDLDIPFGEFKIQFGRGPAGHHGVESIIEALRTDQFWRIRIGIGKPRLGISTESFVLMPFSDQEKEGLSSVFKTILKALGND